MRRRFVQSFHLKNFKAVQDSHVIKFTPLTVLIGDNGSGKSSFVEGLETLQAIVDLGLDRAMQTWRGFEYVWNQSVPHQLRDIQVGDRARKRYEPRHYHTNPMFFELRGQIERGKYFASLEVNAGEGRNEVFIQHEQVAINNRVEYERDSKGGVMDQTLARRPAIGDYWVKDGESILGRSLGSFISDWQFLMLVPQNMGAPVPQMRTGGPVRLAKDGSNIAEYLLDIRRMDPGAFEGFLETLYFVLPYARDLQPALTSELERAVYLQLTEKNFKVPGWLLSTGTLRILALLALLRHPTPPPLIVIEEIENGLDPRTVHLIVDEIRSALEEEKTQVIITTHSPYLLDLLDISQVVLVERKDGQPIFSRPADDEALQDWAKRFSPGRLYTSGRLKTVGDS